MDAYPADYTDHNLPLIFLSGLSSEQPPEEFPSSHCILQENGYTVNGHLPLITGDRANELLQEFLAADGRRAAWNGRTERNNGNPIGFRFRVVGREYSFPAKKAESPEPFPQPSSPTSPSPPTSSGWILHSPISPLSPISPTFPDGVMTPLWVAKHQHHAPSVVISFYSFTSDSNLNSLNDNQLKSEINSVKAMLTKSEYRTRYAVVLLSDKTIPEAPDIEERLGVIRRATGLDPKTSLFFLPPNSSDAEVSSFVKTVLVTLQPICVGYYRDLTKHSRRKKARGTIPPPTTPPTKGTSQTLSLQGWNVRYEFKLGVFAEFRQEMDAACRHYSAAQDILLASDGAFETTASWSPRWNEARLLTDAIAIRTLRCLIWNELPTAAVQTWVSYRDRIRAAIDRRGKGSANYGWAAWESLWAKIMAEIIQRSELPIFHTPTPTHNLAVATEREYPVYARPEKNIPMGERLRPWTLLHHPGYWLRIGAGHAVTRRLLAEDLPEEDRVSPAESSATQVANRSRAYDTYLCPQPHYEYPLPGNEGFNHSNDIVAKYNGAIKEFLARGQSRFVNRIQLDIGKELIDAGRFDEALDVLKPLWSTMKWRHEQWWPLVGEVASSLNQCALSLHDAETVLATEWELLHRDLGRRPGHAHALMNCLDSLPADDLEPSDRPVVCLHTDDVISFLRVTCTFLGQKGNVGEPLKGQISVSSKAHRGSDPVTLSRLSITFEGSLRRIQMHHREDTSLESAEAPSSSRLSELSMGEGADSTSSQLTFSQFSDLTICPGQMKVFQFTVTLREAGEVCPVASQVTINTDRFELSCSTSLEAAESCETWWLRGPKGLRPKQLVKEDGCKVTILPKPPKLELRLPNLRDQYFTDECVTLDIEALNNEDDECEVSIKVQIKESSDQDVKFSWETEDAGSNDELKSAHGDSIHQIGKLKPAARNIESLCFVAPPEQSGYIVEIEARYFLISDPDTPITKRLNVELVFIRPFEANYDFEPLLNREPWPSYFSVEGTSNAEAADDETIPHGEGIVQTWSLAVKVTSFADEVLTISDMRLVLRSVSGGALCSISKEIPSEPQDAEIAPQALEERTFRMDVRKHNLDDKRSSALELNFEVIWRRPGDNSSEVCTTVGVPRLLIPSSEPRVLASSYKSSEVEPLVFLDYTLENPTMHFLTFDLTMEASDEYAFSGRKYGAIQVLPMSRQTVRYNILPFAQGTWISVQLRVVDRYFNKNLRVLAADGVKADKKGVMIWVDVPEEAE